MVLLTDVKVVVEDGGKWWRCGGRGSLSGMVVVSEKRRRR